MLRKKTNNKKKKNEKSLSQQSSAQDIFEEKLPPSVDEIFKKDPLLLQSQSQIEYGKALLENLLVQRSAKFGPPAFVDLYKPATRPAADLDFIPPPPPAKLAKRYFKSRVGRKKLKITKLNETHLINVTALSRGERTQRRLRTAPDWKPPHDIKKKFLTHAKAKSLLAKHNVDIDGRLRIAAVGMRVRISLLQEDTYLNEDLCLAKPLDDTAAIAGMPDDSGIPELGRTRRAAATDPSSARWQRWVDTFSGHIKTAVASGSHVIALPEFALPPEVHKPHMDDRIRDTCFKAGKGQHFSHFVFAGSRHEGASNKGLVFYYKDGEKLHKREWHYKSASARALHENILGPRANTYTSYLVEMRVGERIEPVHITIAICYDTFDPSTFLWLVRQSASIFGKSKQHIILVPSFNPSKDFVDLLRDLSFLTGAVVVYVNSLHGDARAFIAGFGVSAVLDGAGNGILKQISKRLRETDALIADVSKGSPDIPPTPLEEERDRRRKKSLELIKPILKTLRYDLKKLSARRGLDQLITVERCPQCVARSHKDDYGCNADILYYNIDLELLDVLKKWRLQYLTRNESFIPEPFYYDNLQKMAQNDDKRRKEREEEIVRLREMFKKSGVSLNAVR